MRRVTLWGLLTAVLALAVPAGAQATTCTPTLTNPIVRLATTLGNVDVQMNTTYAPCTVNNFLSYADSGAYNHSFFHRSATSPDVIQGGGWTLSSSDQAQAIKAGSAVTNEYNANAPNVADTIAMAQSSAGANSATDQWFFNVADNSTALDGQEFTVFGTALDPDSIAVINKIAAAQVCNLELQWTADDPSGSAFDYPGVPTIGYAAGACTGTSGPKAPPTAATASNLIFINSISVLHDTTAPAIAITSPVQHETLNFGQKVTPSYSCNDGTGTGVASCTGGAVETNLYGTIRYTVTSEDYAGNTDSKTVVYIVELPPAVQSVGTVSSKGVLGITIHCPSSVACVGTAGLTAGKPAANIGTARFDIRSGGTASVRVSLTGAGWNLFRAAKWRLPATLVITPSGTGSQSSSRKLTLTKAKPKPKKHKEHKKPKKKKKKKKK